MLQFPDKDTNVASLLSGEDILSQIPEIVGGSFLVTTMEIPWRIAEPRLGKMPDAVLVADSMERSAVDAQVETAPECDAVVAIGGGRAIDLGKYLAWRRGVRLVTIPTVLSVDAFVTAAAGLREGGRVVYIGETTPDPLVIDYALLRTAPAELNIAGVGDLLSIHTATFDWEVAEHAGASEFRFDASAVQGARAILDDVTKAAGDIRRNSNAGLQAIVDGYIRMNALCVPAGHYRVEEGSEHYLFYELEERTGKPFIHGPIIGLGVYLMSTLQNNDPGFARRFMDEVGLDFHPRSLGIDRDTLRASLLNLKEYVSRRDDLWYSIIDSVSISEEWVDAALATLEFS